MPTRKKANEVRTGNALSREQISVLAVLKAARGETIHLNRQESARFVEALLTPPEPTLALRDLMR